MRTDRVHTDCGRRVGPGSSDEPQGGFAAGGLTAAGDLLHCHGRSRRKKDFADISWSEPDSDQETTKRLAALQVFRFRDQ